MRNLLILAFCAVGLCASVPLDAFAGHFRNGRHGHGFYGYNNVHVYGYNFGTIYGYYPPVVLTPPVYVPAPVQTPEQPMPVAPSPSPPVTAPEPQPIPPPVIDKPPAKPEQLPPPKGDGEKTSLADEIKALLKSGHSVDIMVAPDGSATMHIIPPGSNKT